MNLTWFLLSVLTAVAVAAVALVIWLSGSCARLRRANAELSARAREAERATEAKSRFLANLSHELRTPLNVVIGFAELMGDERAGRAMPLSASQREHLEMIRISADHLLTLINEVLDLARIEAGHMRLEAEPVKPQAIAAQCLDSLRPIAAQKLIGIELHAGPSDTVLLDPARLRQVILNFLANAIRFTTPGGHVTLALVRDGDRLRIEVSDTGVGISEKDQARVFDEFVQVAGQARSGSGLGLAVTRQIVEAQGGEVGVSSSLGSGSTFYAWLPWVAPADTPETSERDDTFASREPREPGVRERRAGRGGPPSTRVGLRAPVGAGSH
jgi:signal transduction histidine kinase